MEQAKHDAKKNGRIPTVIAKKNNKEILVIQRLDDWLPIYREYESSMRLKEVNEEM